MTDNEIIADLKEILALVCCDGDLQRAATIHKAIDLINRQKAEIDELQHKIESLRKFLDMSRKVSLARRDQNIRKDELMIKMVAECKTTKAEAVKEFAARVKRDRRHLVDQNNIDGLIDNLLKEMVGES